MELSSPKPKETYISGENLQSMKIKNSLHFFSQFLRELFKHNWKRKKFLIFSPIKKQNFLN